MKKVSPVILLIMTCIIPSFCDVVFGFGHEVTHPAITSESISISALDDYLKNNLGLSYGVQTELQYDTDIYNSLIKNRIAVGNCEPERTKRTVFNWIRAGSDIEDIDKDANPPLPSIRARHHFHDPIRNSGLDNKYDHSNYSQFINILFFDVTGQSAITWAISGEAPQEPYDNFECWESARYDFHRALTEPQKSSREKFLSMLFLELGFIIQSLNLRRSCHFWKRF
jgi:hypothetical protein